MTRHKGNRTKVLIADDHKVVAEGLAKTLGEYFDIVGQVHELPVLAQEVQRACPDVVVLDLTFDGVSSLPLMREMFDRGDVETRFVVLTAHDSAALQKAALDAGATSFLLKGVGTDILRVAIESAAEGQEFAPKGQWRPRRRGDRRLLNVDGIHLRENQIRVLLLLHDGLNRSQAAEELDLAVRTVDFHLRVTRDALGIRTFGLLLNWVAERREALEAALEGLEAEAPA